jgi:hypothetical protein
MASECIQRETTWDEEAWWQMYGRNNYPTQLQILWDDEASQQMYRLNNYPTQSQIPSDNEASRQMYELNSCLSQPQITCDEEASRQMPQVLPIFALPTARPQRIQQPALGRELPPLTPKQPLLKRGNKGKPKPPKYLTDKERQEICQIHEDNPSAMRKETGGEIELKSGLRVEREIGISGRCISCGVKIRQISKCDDCMICTTCGQQMSRDGKCKLCENSRFEEWLTQMGSLQKDTDDHSEQ